MIYLAGPYTSETFEQHKFNIGRLLTYYIWLQKIKESSIICPPLESAGFDKGPKVLRDIDWMKKCLEMVEECHDIYFVPGWTESYGCNCEYKVAWSCHHTIIELDEIPGGELEMVRMALIGILPYNPLAEYGTYYTDYKLYYRGSPP